MMPSNYGIYTRTFCPIFRSMDNYKLHLLEPIWTYSNNRCILVACTVQNAAVQKQEREHISSKSMASLPLSANGSQAPLVKPAYVNSIATTNYKITCELHNAVERR